MGIQPYFFVISLLALLVKATIPLSDCIVPTVYVTVTASMVPTTTKYTYSTIYGTLTASTSTSLPEISMDQSTVDAITIPAYTLVNDFYTFSASGSSVSGSVLPDSTDINTFSLTQIQSAPDYSATPASDSSTVIVYETLTVLPLPETSSSEGETGSTTTIQTTSFVTEQLTSTTTMTPSASSDNTGAVSSASLSTNLLPSASSGNAAKPSIVTSTTLTLSSVSGILSSETSLGSVVTSTVPSTQWQTAFSSQMSVASLTTSAMVESSSGWFGWNLSTTATSEIASLTTNAVTNVTELSSSTLSYGMPSSVETFNTTSTGTYEAASPTVTATTNLTASSLQTTFGSGRTSSGLRSSSTSILPSSTLTTLTKITLSGPNASSTVQSSSTISVNGTTTTSISSPSSEPSLCGEHGNFVLNFDDIPHLSASNNATVNPMPIFSPYHQFWFGEGFVVVPPPTEPYLPSSGKLLLEFLPMANPVTNALEYTGEIGNGQTELLGCFNFSVFGASMGCDSLGPNCDWQFTGNRYNPSTGSDMQVTTQYLSTPSCTSISATATCTLVALLLDNSFQNLTSMSINVTVAGEPKIWWMDDLHLGWYDNSCDAGLCRQENI